MDDYNTIPKLVQLGKWYFPQLCFGIDFCKMNQVSY